jgi:hypothetical protein
MENSMEKELDINMENKCKFNFLLEKDKNEQYFDFEKEIEKAELIIEQTRYLSTPDLPDFHSLPDFVKKKYVDDMLASAGNVACSDHSFCSGIYASFGLSSYCEEQSLLEKIEERQYYLELAKRYGDVNDFVKANEMLELSDKIKIDNYI